MEGILNTILSLEPSGLVPCYQPIMGFLALAHYNGHSFCPVGIDEPGGETLFRKLIRKPTNRPLDTDEVLLVDLNLRLVIADDGHPQTLLSSPGIAQLPCVSMNVCLLTLRIAAAGLWCLPGPCKHPSLSENLDPDKLGPHFNSLSSSCVCSPDILDICRFRV